LPSKAVNPPYKAGLRRGDAVAISEQDRRCDKYASDHNRNSLHHCIASRLKLNQLSSRQLSFKFGIGERFPNKRFTFSDMAYRSGLGLS